jgi:hypothetical protein
MNEFAKEAELSEWFCDPKKYNSGTGLHVKMAWNQPDQRKS